MPPGILLIKSPFLVIKEFDNVVRMYSKLYGNLSTFTPEIRPIIDIFHSPKTLEKALPEAAGLSKEDPVPIIRDLFEKQFLVNSDKSAEDMFLEYVGRMKENDKNPKISDITFLISSECNLACKGCYHSFYHFENDSASKDRLIKILRSYFNYIKNIKIDKIDISFLGYEPFLSFDLMRSIHEEACHLSTELGVKPVFRIFTNAFDINESIFNWVSDNKRNLRIKISIDGIKEDNDKRRVDIFGNGTYDKVINNIKKFIQNRIQCSVLIVLSKLNINNLENFVSEMYSLGIKHITANLFCGHSKEEIQMELNTSEKIDAIKRMDIATEKYGIKLDGEWRYALLQMVSGAEFSCPAGKKQLVFSADGTVYPCQRFAGTPVHFGRHDDGFFERLATCRCDGYNRWNEDLYNGAMDRVEKRGFDLSGWSCPFLEFIRGESLNANPEREFNERLIDYYMTRPIDRILSR